MRKITLASTTQALARVIFRTVARRTGHFSGFCRPIACAESFHILATFFANPPDKNGRIGAQTSQKLHFLFRCYSRGGDRVRRHRTTQPKRRSVAGVGAELWQACAESFDMVAAIFPNVRGARRSEGFAVGPKLSFLASCYAPGGARARRESSP